MTITRRAAILGASALPTLAKGLASASVGTGANVPVVFRNAISGEGMQVDPVIEKLNKASERLSRTRSKYYAQSSERRQLAPVRPSISGLRSFSDAAKLDAELEARQRDHVREREALRPHREAFIALCDSLGASTDNWSWLLGDDE